MIKVTVGEQKTQSEKPFPKLMIHKDGSVTFFKRSGVGTHLYAKGDMAHIIGNHCSEIGMLGYSDFNEPITLQNS